MSEFTEFTNSDDSNSEDQPTPVDMLEQAAALTSFGHAMADYFLSNDDAFAGFCAFAGIESEEDTAHMREILPNVHDTFASLCDRARKELVMTQLMSMFGPAPAAS